MSNDPIQRSKSAHDEPIDYPRPPAPHSASEHQDEKTGGYDDDQSKKKEKKRQEQGHGLHGQGHHEHMKADYNRPSKEQLVGKASGGAARIVQPQGKGVIM